MKLLYAVLNPVVKSLLRSPLHALMSSNTMIIEFTGRRSGKQFELPVSYAVHDGGLLGFTDRKGQWWRNFQEARPASLLVARHRQQATVEALADDDAQLEDLLAVFLKAVPRDAAPAGVTMQGGEPVAEDLARAARGLVALRYKFDDQGETHHG